LSSGRERGEAELGAILRLLERLRAHDEATYRHARSVGLWCHKLSLEVGATATEAEYIERAGALHDVGKLQTPLAILNKPGPLTQDEWHSMRDHARQGAEICEQTPLLARFAPAVRAHHERVDGEGYPYRLAGADIPVEAQIIAVADSFHAMISMRGYAPAKTPREAFAELERGSGTQFSAPIVGAFFRLVGYRGAAEAAERGARSA
jgi:putative nucleotidyltransferase with HDIG domain